MTQTPALLGPLPSSYSWGFVTGRFIHAQADTTGDLDRFPEARGSNGRVTFSPLERLKKVLDGEPAFVNHEDVLANVVDGYIVDAEGYEGIYLISGAYRVSFNISGMSIPTFDIEVTGDYDIDNPLDLVVVSPYVNPARTIVQTLRVSSGVNEGDVLIKVGDTVMGVPPEDVGGNVSEMVLQYFSDNPVSGMPQSLVGNAARFRGIFEVEPETMPDLTIGDWIIVLEPQ